MASRSILVRSSSHHGSASAEKRVTRKRDPLNTRNVVSIQRSKNPIAGVFAYHTSRGVICRHIRAERATEGGVMERSYYSVQGQTAVFYSRIKSAVIQTAHNRGLSFIEKNGVKPAKADAFRREKA